MADTQAGKMTADWEPLDEATLNRLREYWSSPCTSAAPDGKMPRRYLATISTIQAELEAARADNAILLKELVYRCVKADSHGRAYCVMCRNQWISTPYHKPECPLAQPHPGAKFLAELEDAELRANTHANDLVQMEVRAEKAEAELAEARRALLDLSVVILWRQEYPGGISKPYARACKMCGEQADYPAMPTHKPTCLLASGETT